MKVNRGRSRGRQPSRRVPTHKFPRFSEKLHEIKKILVRRGAPRGRPLDPPLVKIVKNLQILVGVSLIALV